MLNISEIFYSIQGETSYTGLPTIFVRLAKCNLRCNYCDTKYSYQSDIYKSINEILDEVKSFKPIKLVCITGGEPLLQNEVYALFNRLLQQNYHILLETNGSLLINKVPMQVIRIIDFKAPTSEMSDKNCWENINYLNPVDEVKFVLQNRADFLWAVKQVKQYNLTDKCKVLFSPVHNKLTYKQLANWILDVRMQIRLQLQLHKLISIR
ncbi:MAG: 7-carboxy-7-deazaguanine synthase QueE [Candidatus Cloacimonadota bacterium]|nr:MAG: 7-carboxy-7-deazaguanine synthase QueE [Candidatus Cloacimonadota bacterium]